MTDKTLILALRQAADADETTTATAILMLRAAERLPALSEAAAPIPGAAEMSDAMHGQA